MKETAVYKTIPLKESKGGTLNFAVIEEPYGEGSKPVVSICATLNEKESWKVHIPLSQIKEVRQALKEAKKTRKKEKSKTKNKDKEVKKAKKAKNSKTATKEVKETKATKKQAQ